MKKAIFLCIVLITLAIPVFSAITPTQSAQPSEDPGNIPQILAALLPVDEIFSLAGLSEAEAETAPAISSQDQTDW